MSNIDVWIDLQIQEIMINIKKMMVTMMNIQVMMIVVVLI